MKTGKFSFHDCRLNYWQAGQSLCGKMVDLDETYENTKSANIIPDDPILSLSLHLPEIPQGNFLYFHSVFM